MEKYRNLARSQIKKKNSHKNVAGNEKIATGFFF